MLPLSRRVPICITTVHVAVLLPLLLQGLFRQTLRQIGMRHPAEMMEDAKRSTRAAPFCEWAVRALTLIVIVCNDDSS